MKKKLNIHSLNRKEGFLSVEVVIEKSKIIDARCSGNLFRNFENIIPGRDIHDSVQVSQRICSSCSIAHAIAMSSAIESAANKKINTNALIMRNLMLAASFIDAHISHFYLYSAMDFIDNAAILSYKGKDESLIAFKSWFENQQAAKLGKPDELTIASPFLPRYQSTYCKNNDLNIHVIKTYMDILNIRKMLQHLIALLGGRSPHQLSILPGGLTQQPSSHLISQYKKTFNKLHNFINNVFTNHLVTLVGEFNSYFNIGSFNNMLSYSGFPALDNKKSTLFKAGVYLNKTPGIYDGNGKAFNFDDDLIQEYTNYSFYKHSKINPKEGTTIPDGSKNKAYSWIKAPRYEGNPMEVGPLARTVIGYLNDYTGTSLVKKEVDNLLRITGKDISAIFSLWGRHLSRLVESKMFCQKSLEWIELIDKNKSAYEPFQFTGSSSAKGLIEGPNGSLGHWITIQNKKIITHQSISGSTWNCSPRDNKGIKGPLEHALIGTSIEDEKNPIEIVRVVRSFNPCVTCATH